jgi:hypothetical protein
MVGPSGRFANFSSFRIGFEPLLPPSVGQIRPYLSESLLGTVAARPYRVNVLPYNVKVHVVKQSTPISPQGK